jgi:ADP-ribose pyrophosphatase YjhB (NUDIX family)
VIERVRAIVLTPGGDLLVIKRTKPGMAPYWKFAGGHVEDSDASLEDGLRRELREELEAEATILRMVAAVDRENERQYFYLVTMDTWSKGDLTGAGSYEFQEIPVRAEEIERINLVPNEVAEFLVSSLRSNGRLTELPDLRDASA